MKIVLDTNVLVSGLIKPSSPPGQIVQMASTGALSICYDVRILTEYGTVLSRPRFKIDTQEIGSLLEQIKEDGHLVVGHPLPFRLPDPDDEAFLEVAIAGGARCLVTGNIKDYPTSKRQGMEVVTPAEFLDIYRKETK